VERETFREKEKPVALVAVRSSSGRRTHRADGTKRAMATLVVQQPGVIYTGLWAGLQVSSRI